MRRIWTSVGIMAISVAAAGCGKKSDAKDPSSEDFAAAPGAPAGGGQVATASGGQQYAISDAPTSGASAANRPKMNAAAAQAYQAGLQAFQAGDLAGAKTQFSNAVKADAKAYQAHYSLGVVEQRLGKRSAALSAYRAAQGIVKDYEPAIAAYGVLLARGGDAGEAESFLSRQRAALPESAAVLAALAEVKSILKDSASAQSLAQQALKKNPDYRPAMVTLARDHYRNRRLDLAQYTLTAILDGYGAENPARDKNNAGAILLRGLIYKEQGNRREAIAMFKRAVELRPDLVEARINLAKYMLEAGNATEAIPLLETALRYDSTNPLIHLNLGDAYRLQGRVADARKHFEWVISKDSSLSEAHYNLGLLYLFSKQVPGMKPAQAIDKALAHFERYKEMRPRTRAGAGDDVEELINRARNKKSIIEAMAAQPPPEPAPAPAPAPQGGAGGGASSGALPPAQ